MICQIAGEEISLSFKDGEEHFFDQHGLLINMLNSSIFDR